MLDDLLMSVSPRASCRRTRSSRPHYNRLHSPRVGKRGYCTPYDNVNRPSDFCQLNQLFTSRMHAEARSTVTYLAPAGLLVSNRLRAIPRSSQPRPRPLKLSKNIPAKSESEN